VGLDALGWLHRGLPGHLRREGSGTGPAHALRPVFAV
jgi:hypothetical protein